MDSWAGDPHDPRRLEFLQSRIEKLQESQLTIMEGLSSMVDIEDEDEA